MMFKNHFGETVTVVLALVMGFCMALAVIVIDGLAWNYSNVFKLWAMITLVILLVSIVIPYKDWSGKIAGKFPFEEGSAGYKIIDNVLPTLILNTCITVCVAAANILYNESIPEEIQIEEWIAGMLHDWPITLVISYFVAFVAEAIGVWVAKRTGEG